jgi:hypothetical protein
MPFLLAALKAILIKLATQEAIEFLLVWLAEIASKSTKTTYDDELVDKIKELLGRK